MIFNGLSSLAGSALASEEPPVLSPPVAESEDESSLDPQEASSRPAVTASETVINLRIGSPLLWMAHPPASSPFIAGDHHDVMPFTESTHRLAGSPTVRLVTVA
jgi:hypothetical protein